MSVRSPALEYLFGLEQFGIKFGLDNMRALVDALGHPERAYATVHIAGTNGKGSVTAMVDAAVRAAGSRSARYTSPHLCDLAERFVIDGRPIDTDVLEEAADRLQATASRLTEAGRLAAPPTFFEATTAIAFELFRNAGVPLAVIEVGLGGRLDATNVVEPAVTAITSIGYDHQQYLGSTLAEIAAEKAGIIKPGIPVVVGPMGDESATAIARIARSQGSPLVRADQGVTIKDEGAAPSMGRRMYLRTPAADYGRIDLALAGDHQVTNALTAVKILELLQEQGMPITPAAVRSGLETVVWPGRMDRRRLPDGRDILLDAAHNVEGAQALSRFLASNFPEPPILIFAAMRDKDVAGMLQWLVPYVRALVLTRAETPRSADPASLAEIARAGIASCPVVVAPDVELALDAAASLGSTVVVAGSIFLLGDVMRVLGRS